jgi:hypothetical protein
MIQARGDDEFRDIHLFLLFSEGKHAGPKNKVDGAGDWVHKQDRAQECRFHDVRVVRRVMRQEDDIVGEGGMERGTWCYTNRLT